MNKQVLHTKSILFLFMFFVIFTSCKNDKPKEVTEKEVKITNVNFYLDNSLSNAGYYGQIDFNKVVGGLFSKACKGFNRNLFTISDSLGITAKFSENEFDEINITALKKEINQSSSTIYTMLAKIMNQTDDSTISIFISDCILSHPKKSVDEIKQINLIDIQSETLKNKTISAVSKSFKDSIKSKSAFSVYYFTSDFDGQYYFNAMNKNLIKGTLKNRPFYVWVLTKNINLLNLFNQKLASINHFNDNPNKIDFGVTEDKSQDILFISKSKESKCTLTPRNAIENVNFEDSKDKKIEFTFCTYLKGLENVPINELASNLEILPKDNHFEVTFLNRDTILASKEFNAIEDDTKQKKIQNSTHFIKVSFDKLYGNDTLQIIKKYSYPRWYLNKFTHDDTKSVEEYKTFGIDQIIEAFKETMEDDKRNIINIKIPISK